MAEKWAMAGTFELTPELRGSLGLRDREYADRLKREMGEA